MGAECRQVCACETADRPTDRPTVHPAYPLRLGSWVTRLVQRPSRGSYNDVWTCARKTDADPIPHTTDAVHTHTHTHSHTLTHTHTHTSVQPTDGIASSVSAQPMASPQPSTPSHMTLFGVHAHTTPSAGQKQPNFCGAIAPVNMCTSFSRMSPSAFIPPNTHKWFCTTYDVWNARGAGTSPACRSSVHDPTCASNCHKSFMTLRGS